MQLRTVNVEDLYSSVPQRIAKDSYISFVSSQVMKGVVAHPETEPDWIGPRMRHASGKFLASDATIYEGIRLAEEMADGEA